MGKTIRVWNPETKSFETQDVTKERGQKASIERISILQRQYQAILGFAKADGFELEAETEMGTKMRKSKAVQQYVEQALEEFIAARIASNS